MGKGQGTDEEMRQTSGDGRDVPPLVPLSSRSSGRPLAAILLPLLALLFCSASASAFSQRGHAFGSSFGEGVTASVTQASAIAVNEASTGEAAGDVYVLESANNRVARFGPAPEHKFIEVWGYGVQDGKNKAETCKEKCLPGIAGFGGTQFDAPLAIAVDNSGSASDPSAGDVYVVANGSKEEGVIDKFNFKGEPVHRLIGGEEAKEEAEGAIDGVAIDPSGVVWVEREDEEEEFVLQRYSDALKNKLLESVEVAVPEELFEGVRPTRPGFAVDSVGDIYLTYEPGGKDLEERESAEELGTTQECEKNPCLTTELRVGLNASSEPEAKIVHAEFDTENTTGVAVDLSNETESSGDVYLDNGTSLAAFTSGGALIQRFGAQQLEQGGASGLAVDSKTDEVLIGDPVAGRVDVYVNTPAGKPVVKPESASAGHVTSSSARLRTTIDPTGLDTHYRFLYGTVECAGEPSQCTAEVPAKPGTDIGAGWIDQVATVEVTGLAPSTTYHFLALAENASGEVHGEEATFTTLASGESEATLPDGRAWELVSPADKRGVAIQPIAHEGGVVEASAGGEGLTFLTSAPAGEEEPAGNRAPEPSQLISSRQAPGDWSVRNITTPNQAPQGIKAEERREYQFFSSNLSLALVFPIESLAESETTEATTGATIGSTVYLREPGCATAPCYAPLVSVAHKGLQFQGATPDLEHVIVRSPEPLVEGASGEGLYEWSAAPVAFEKGRQQGHFKLVSILPGGVDSSGLVGLGTVQIYEGPRHAISEDGSRVVWKSLKTGHLYMSELKEGQPEVTTQIDPTDEKSEAAEPVFETANVTDSRVFFTDNPRRVNGGSRNEESGDLYVFEPEKPAGEQLTDLTPDARAGEVAAVQGAIEASEERAGEEGMYVYYVANGALAEGAQPGDCEFEGPRSATCNLYVVHDNGTEWEEPQFIARLSSEDAPDWSPITKGSREYELVSLTSRVSPNGRYFAFMSNRRLTGYNNTDEKSGAADEEVFLFHAPEDPAAEPGSLVCASCNPSGAQPVGVHDVQESGEGRGLLVDRPGVWSTEVELHQDNWLAASVPGWTGMTTGEALYQSRYLSDHGRLFFNSADSLVKQDTNGKEDVYEYEPVGVGGCERENTAGGCVALVSSGKSEQESAFLDASETGNDVFFLTSAKLTPQDPDNAFDIYDARVCSGAGATAACPTYAPPPPPPCNSEETCKGSSSSTSTSYGAPASSLLSGSGNLVAKVVVEAEKQKVAPKPLTKRQLLEKALKACKKDKRRSKRVACERLARKRHGAKATKASKSSAGHGPTGSASSRTRR
jgi:hypothetical protein